LIREKGEAMEKSLITEPEHVDNEWIVKHRNRAGKIEHKKISIPEHF